MGPKPARGKSIMFRPAAFVSTMALSAVAVVLATASVAANGPVRWPVAELAVMGIALAALPVAYFASGVRILLEAGETKPIRAGDMDYWVARLFFLIAIPIISLSVSFAMWHILLGRSGDFDGSATQLSGPKISASWLIVVGIGLATFLLFQFYIEIALHKFGRLYLTNRRVIRFTQGYWSGRIEVLALADVAEIHEGVQGILLVASSRDAMRRMQPDGSTEPAGIDRLHLPLLRFRLPGTAMSQYDRAIQSIGRRPLRWHAPTLPRDVGRLVAIEAKYRDIVWVPVVIVMLTAVIADIARPDAIRGLSHDMLAVAALTSSAALLAFGAIGYWLFLRLSARRLTPEKAALFLRASFDPDWNPGRWPRSPYTAARRATLKRRERFVSWLAGGPVSIEDAPGPEAFGGGWRQ